MSSLAKGFLAAALVVGLSIGGFVLGAAIRYQWDSQGGWETSIWRASSALESALSREGSHPRSFC